MDCMSKPQWIPIDANVPTNSQRVLVCFDDGFVSVGAYINYTENEKDEEEPFWVFDGEEDFNLEDGHVTAWMPLPEPYKKEPTIINASDIKPDDEWMQENDWDEIYKKESEGKE